MGDHLALVVTVPVSEQELASDALWALGVVAVEERESDGGFVELWTSLGDDRDAVISAAEGFPARWRWKLADVDASVVDTWRHHVTPTWIERDLVVVPSWLDADTAPGALRLEIDPGAAFGLGDHPTTMLSARLLRHTWWPGATVLDVGTGSGLLAVLAARLGAPYVRAIDISAAAVDATQKNAERNGVAAAIVADSTSLAEIDEQADIVIANLLAPILIDLADQLRRVTAPAGALIVSGVLERSHQHVLDALAPMRAVETLSKDGWSAILLRH